MLEYDTTLKNLLMRLAGSTMARLTGFEIARWHNAELPAVRHRRADLLGETADRRLVHIELQSTNQPWMVRRMLEYSLAIHRKFGRFPEQLVLYVGNARLRMKSELKAPGLSYRCRMEDVRDMESAPLLASPLPEDNVFAVLPLLGSERDAVKTILRRIDEAEPAGRAQNLGELLTLAGLRRLAPMIETEIEQMPILDDIMDHEVLGRERRRGIELGRVEGRTEGRMEGERVVLVRQITRRFGAIPAWAQSRLESLNTNDLERIELRIFDARSIDELFDLS